MTRKTKAFWIGFLVPVVMLWAWTFVFARGWSAWWSIFLTGAAVVAGGLVGLIAYLCTSGPPMSRRGKAAWIGFFVPVVPGGIIMLLCFVDTVGSHDNSAALGGRTLSFLVCLFFGFGSILLGGVIAAIAFAAVAFAQRTKTR